MSMFAALTTRQRQVLLAVLLLAGVALWYVSARAQWQPWPQVAILGAALAILLIPAVHKPLARGLDALRTPSPQAAAGIAMGAGAVAASYFLYSTIATGRPHVPQWHDEHMTMIQIQMLARGRLWMPEHELADFFENLFVESHGVYASIYFPGAALFFVPTVWLGLPTWAMPLLVTSAVVGLTYWVVTEVMDGLMGLLAAYLMMSLGFLRLFSVMLVSHPVMCLLGLLMLSAWLGWRRNLGVGWAIFLGAMAGWAAITRPLDAVCFALPIGIAMLWRLRREPAKRWVLSLAPAVVAALPFLGLQVVQNVGITGNPLKTPYVQYLERYQPNTAPGFRGIDRSLRPESTLQQKHDYYDHFLIHYLEQHRLADVPKTLFGDRLPKVFASVLPHMLLAIFLPAAALALTDGRRRVVAAIPLLFLGLYTLNPVFLPHYAVVFSPTFVVLAVLGAESIASAAGRCRDFLLAAGAVTILVLGTAGFPELNLGTGGHGGMETVTNAAQELENLPYKPAVVLFPYEHTPQRRMNFHDEPVYNITTAWPDDAEVIRAHGRGDDDIRIIRYYAQRQPERHFYVYDRHTHQVIHLGRGPELLRERE